MGDVVAITRYRSTDGKEFTRREDAEERDAYLRAESMIYASQPRRYSDDYDGPMPVGPPMSAEYMFRHRALLRNIFLDLPEPTPQIIVNTVYEKVYYWPMVLMICSLLFGLFLGWRYL